MLCSDIKHTGFELAPWGVLHSAEASFCAHSAEGGEFNGMSYSAEGSESFATDGGGAGFGKSVYNKDESRRIQEALQTKLGDGEMASRKGPGNQQLT